MVQMISAVLVAFAAIYGNHVKEIALEAVPYLKLIDLHQLMTDAVDPRDGMHTQLVSLLVSENRSFSLLLCCSSVTTSSMTSSYAIVKLLEKLLLLDRGSSLFLGRSTVLAQTCLPASHLLAPLFCLYWYTVSYFEVTYHPREFMRARL